MQPHEVLAFSGVTQEPPKSPRVPGRHKLNRCADN